MKRIQYIEYKGKRVLLEDFTGMKPGQEFTDTLNEAKQTIHSQPEGSVIALFDATNALFDQKVIDQVKEFTASNKPFVKTSAVVGITGLLKIALMTVSRFSGRNFKTFETRDEALEWLIAQ